MVSATDFLPLTITWFMNFAKVDVAELGIWQDFASWRLLVF